MHRYQEFDALIAAVLALAVTLATCWLLATVVPPAVTAKLAPKAVLERGEMRQTGPRAESDWVY
jgi:hypothetical protein